jgi:hypothetical protein
MSKKFGNPIKEIVFTVPDDYEHDTQLETFVQNIKNKDSKYQYNINFLDKNFKKISHKLVPGKNYDIKFIPVLESVSNEDCLYEYRRQNAVLVGAQGLTSLQCIHPNEFPIGKWSLSFDERYNLWEDGDSRHRVPSVYRGSDGDWNFYLDYFECDRDHEDMLICFCEQILED